MTTVEDDESTAAGPRTSRRATIAMIAFAAVLVAVVVWFGAAEFQRPLRWRDVGFTIDSPTAATATFDVFLFTDQDATCSLKALNEHYTIVGVGTVDIERDAGDAQRITTSLATTELATTMLVEGCATRP